MSQGQHRQIRVAPRLPYSTVPSAGADSGLRRQDVDVVHILQMNPRMPRGVARDQNHGSWSTVGSQDFEADRHGQVLVRDVGLRQTGQIEINEAVGGVRSTSSAHLCRAGGCSVPVTLDRCSLSTHGAQTVSEVGPTVFRHMRSSIRSGHGGRPRQVERWTSIRWHPRRFHRRLVHMEVDDAVVGVRAHG